MVSDLSHFSTDKFCQPNLAPIVVKNLLVGSCTLCYRQPHFIRMFVTLKRYLSNSNCMCVSEVFVFLVQQLSQSPKTARIYRLPVLLLIPAFFLDFFLRLCPLSILDGVSTRTSRVSNFRKQEKKVENIFFVFFFSHPRYSLFFFLLFPFVSHFFFSFSFIQWGGTEEAKKSLNQVHYTPMVL